MKTKIHLYSGLQKYTNNQNPVEAEGNTIGECLESLTRQFPEIKSQLFDNEGKKLPTVMISINLQSTLSEELDKSISKGDQLYIILIVPGG